MNIAELYSLSSGKKLDKISIYDKYYALNTDNYIVIQPWSKASKNYDYWPQVLEIIHHVLEKLGISIIQVGGLNELPLNRCVHTQGSTNYGQLSYLISKARLVLSADSVSSHLAGHHNVPLVVLISNNFKEAVAPYYGDKSKQIILEPDRTKRNPSFSLDEGPNKQINEIKPEEIAATVFKLLNIDYAHPYKTLYFGDTFKSPVIESVPNGLINPQSLNLQNLIVRMDYIFDENILAQQLNLGNCMIVTNKPINIQLLKQFAPRISQLYYVLGKDHDLNFIKELNKTPTKYVVFSYESEEYLQTLKLDYYKHCVIYPKKIASKTDIKELKDKNLDNVFFKSNKFTLSNGKIYPSKLSYIQDKPIQNLECPWLKFEDNIENWLELEYFYLAEKIS